MAEFVVECYVSRTDAAAVEHRAERSALTLALQARLEPFDPPKEA